MTDDDNRLDAAYARIPSANCKGLCLDGCCSVAMTGIEQRRIEQRHGIRLPLVGVFADGCPALSPAGRCLVYEDRPAVCRLYGVVPGMTCPHNCDPEVMLTDVAARHLLDGIEALDGNVGRAERLRRRQAANQTPGEPAGQQRDG